MQLKTIKLEKGLTIFEAILAIAIVFLIIPFAYKKINSTTQEIQDISIAKYITNFNNPILNYIKINQNLWESIGTQEIDSNEFLSKLEDYGLKESDMKFQNYITSYSVIIKKTTNASGGSIINAYLIVEFSNDFSQIRLTKIAKQMGASAGTIGPDGIVHSILGNWILDSSNIKNNVIVYKVDTTNQTVQNISYLHRLKMGSREDLNKMETTLYFGDAFYKFNIAFTKDVFGNLLNITRDIATFVLNADNIETDTVYFSDGAIFNPLEKSNQILSIQNIIINGLIIGEDKNLIKTKNLFGAIDLDNVSEIKKQTYHQQGSIISNTTTFKDNGKIIVGRLLDLSGISSSEDDIDSDKTESENDIISTFNYMETNSLYLNYLTASNSINFTNGVMISSGGGIYLCAYENCDYTKNNKQRFTPIISEDNNLDTYFMDLKKLTIYYKNNQEQMESEDYILKLNNLNTSSPSNIGRIIGNWR